MKVVHFSVHHPTIITMILIALIAFAGYSFSGLSLEFVSDISLPTVQVITIYPGASAEDVENDVTKIIEDNFVTLPNYKSMISKSNNSYSYIEVTFNDGLDPYEQLEEMRYRISQLVDDLPENLLGEPQVMVGGGDMLPVLTISVSAGDDIGRVSDYVINDLKPRLNQIAGVSSVTVKGAKNLQVSVKLRLDDLVAKQISVVDVYNSLKAGNIKLPLGTGEYEGKSLDLRYEGDFDSINDIQGLPVGVDDNNVIIRMRDVADVTLDYEKPEYYVDGSHGEIVIVEIAKRSGGNIIKITDTAKEILNEETQKSGGALKFEIVDDTSEFTKVAVKTVLQSGLQGLIFAILVIALFLGDFRATLIISLSIPLSVLFTFIGMRITGMTVNVLSSAGLVVALGMIVDGSIVMIEQVFRYYSKSTRSLNESIFMGSDEVGIAIFASAVTTIVVFIPILFLNELLGQILHDISLVLVLAISGSFITAIVVVPYLMKHILKEKKTFYKKKRIFNRFMNKVENGYKIALQWSMKTHRYVILLSCLVLFLTLFIIQALGFTYLPSVDMNSFDINLEFPQGYSVEQTRDKTLEVMDIVKDKIPEINSYVAYSGNNGQAISTNIKNESNLHIVLKDKNLRERDVYQIILLLQEDLSANVPDCIVTVSNGGFDKLLSYVSGGGYGLTLVGEDIDELYKVAKQIESEMATDDTVVTTEINTDYDSATLRLDMNHELLSSVGVNSYEAGITSIILFNGLDTGVFHSKNGEYYDIEISSDINDEPITVDSIAKIEVMSASGSLINFANLGEVTIENALSTINHTDRAKTLTVSAKLVSEDASPINSHINKYLKANPLPDGITTKPGGIMELISKSIKPMVTAIIIAWFLVYMVMVFQFEKFKQPLIIMFTIPFCLIGILLGLLLFGSTISLIAILGMLSLGGIVVNNGIILIDYFNTKRKILPETIENLKSVVVIGSASRLRPILMTSLSTMLCVVPMAFSLGEGSELYAPLGQAIVGGLFSSTLISLFIVPTVYYVTERLSLFRKEKKAKLNGGVYRCDTGLPGYNLDGSVIEFNSLEDGDI